MGIVVIGATGHGKSTLVKAIEQLTMLEFVELNTVDFIEAGRKQMELKDSSTDLIFNTKELKRKNKETKPWKKAKFYQG